MVRTDERRARIRQVRHRLASAGPPWARDRERDFETVTLPARDCDLLRDLLVAEGVETVVEIGLAYAGGTTMPLGGDPRAGSVPRCRAFRLPDPTFEPPFEEFCPF